FLTDEPEVAHKKIMGATTDDKANVTYNPAEQPGISNLLQILSLLRSNSIEETAKEFEGTTRYGDFKTIVATEVADFLRNFQANLANIDEAAIVHKLEQSEAAMNEQANSTLYKVQQAVGLRAKA